MKLIRAWLTRRKRAREFLEDLKNPKAKIDREYKELMTQWGAAHIQNQSLKARDLRIKMIQLEQKRKK